MTRAEMLQSNKPLAYRLRCYESAYDALLDHVLADFMPDDKKEDRAYLLEQKLKYHASFSDACVKALSEGKEYPDFPKSFSSYEGAWRDLVSHMQKVNASPIAHYDAVNHKILSEGLKEGFQMGKTGSMNEQSVLFALGRGEMFSFSASSIDQAVSDPSMIDASGRIPLSKGNWSGFYQSHKRDAGRSYIANVGPLVLNEYMKKHANMPLSLSECYRIHDKLMENTKTAGPDLSDVWDAFMSSHQFYDAYDVPSYDDFEKYAKENGPFKGYSFADDVSVRSLKVWMDGQGRAISNTGKDPVQYMVYDVFGKDKKGQRIANQEYIQAFLNRDLSAQAEVLGKVPAKARISKSGVSYVDNDGNAVSASDAYTDAAAINPFLFPVARSDGKNGYVLESGHPSIGLLDIKAGRVVNEVSRIDIMDQMGLSAFRPYLHASVYIEFKEAVHNMRESGNLKLPTYPGYTSSALLSQSVKNGIAVLEELDKRGFAYEIVPDLGKGQLMAVVDEPAAVKFRVVDLEHPEYVGRCHYAYSGSATRFNNDGVKMKGADGKWKAAPIMPDTDMVRDLVSYSLGEPVSIRQPEGGRIYLDGKEGQKVGGRGLVTYKPDGSSYTLKATAKPSDPGMDKNGSFLSSDGKGFLSFYGVRVDTWPSGQKILTPIRIRNERSGDVPKIMSFSDNASAQLYLDDIQKEASDYLKNQVLEPLFVFTEKDGETMVQAKPADELSSVLLSDDPQIRALQEQYVKFLSADDAVLRDLANDGSMRDALDDVYTLDRLGLLSVLGDNRSKEQAVLDSIDDVTKKLVGSVHFSENGDKVRDFNFANTVKFAGVKERDVIRALQAADDEPVVNLISENEDASMNRIKEQIVFFDKSSAVSLEHVPIDNPFLFHVHDVIKESMESHGVTVSDIEIDNNGIVHYTGTRSYGETVGTGIRYAEKRAENAIGRDYREVDGMIGQIFVPDELGVITTKFAHDDNYSMVPGYMASVSRGEGSVESRTVCKGYEQILDAKIRYQMHQNLSNGFEEDTLQSTSLNKVYRHLYDERYPEDYREYFNSIGMGDQLMEATIATQKGAVRYDKRYIEESTLNARVAASKSNLVNDAVYDCYSVTGRDMSVMGWSEDGYFDDSATQSGTGQGVSRYLVSGAKVDHDGHIVKSEILHDKAPVLNLDIMEDFHNNPPDRRTMVFLNMMHSFGVTERMGTAHMTLEGWTMDDAFVISSDYADAYRVPDGKGGYRPLQKGDKLCDLNGNKGVISLVVDRNMDLKTAKDQGIEGPVKLFRNNPGLDCVGSPFTAPSRMNGGTARNMMKGNVRDLVLADGSVVAGGLSDAHYIVTDKTVDEKTHVYDEEDIKSGKGRSVSSQMLWSLQARGAKNLINEFFSGNADNLRVIREKMIVMGMDLDPDYVIHRGYTPHEISGGLFEDRPVIELPKPPENYADMTQSEANIWKSNAVKESFSRVSRNGGFLKVPFNIKLASGIGLSAAPDGDGYLLPLMPPVFRSDQTYDDNTAIFHDYTQAYGQIAEKCMDWYCEDARPVKDVDKHTIRMENAQIKAQNAYDRMAEEIRSISFDNKWNDWKRRAMSHRMPNSITAVGTPDPRLDLDEVSMNSDMMKHMGLKEGEYGLFWRDPLLRPEGIAAMRVKLDESVSGIAINPAMDQRYDGDFDGDTWGGVPVKGEATLKEAIELFSVRNTMIDLGPTPDARTKDNITLALNTGLDIASAKGVNQAEPSDIALESKMDSAKEALACGADSKGYTLLNEYVHERLSQAHGSTVIRYDSMQSHMESVCEMVNIGAKGKPAGVKEYAYWLGVDAEFDVDESAKQIHVKSVKDLGVPGMLDDSDKVRREMLLNMNIQVNMATAIKSFGTGLAGAVSQKNVGLTRKACPDGIHCDAYLRYALETTYGATQGILQAKHDAKEALQKYKILTDVLPALYAGRAIGMQEDGTWAAVEAEGKPVWNSKQDFIDQYAKLCESKTGLNFDLARDNIEKLADCLYDGNEDSYGNDKIRRPNDKGMKEISTIDHLAYAQGNFDTLVAMEGRCLFDTEYSRMFAPKSEPGGDKFASLAARAGCFEATKPGRDVRNLADVRVVDKEAAPSYHRESRETAACGLRPADKIIMECDMMDMLSGDEQEQEICV